MIGAAVNLPSGRVATLRVGMEWLPAVMANGDLELGDLEALEDASAGRLTDPEAAERLLPLVLAAAVLDPAPDDLDQADQDEVIYLAFAGLAGSEPQQETTHG